MGGDPAEIRNEHLQDTSIERYRYANPLSLIFLELRCYYCRCAICTWVSVVK
jgi:hypothetical protein